MSRIRGIVFDKDGTLIDFHATWIGVARKLALRAAGGDPVRADMLLGQAGYNAATGHFASDSIFAAGTNAEVVELWYAGLDGEARRAMVRDFDDFAAREGAASAVALPGVPEAVSTLRASGYRLGVATNDSTAGAERTLLALGLAQMFDAAYGYDAVAAPKPAPDMIHAFADMASLKPAEVAIVGDSRHDLQTGRAAGAGLIVGVLSGTGSRAALEPLADIVLDSAADLPGWLKGRG